MGGMETCKTCKWWGQVAYRAMPYGPGDVRIELREEDEADHSRVHQQCGCPRIVYGGNLDEKEEASLPRDHAIYWDTESYYAGFRTGPDFGCVHHEPMLPGKDSNLQPAG